MIQLESLLAISDWLSWTLLTLLMQKRVGRHFSETLIIIIIISGVQESRSKSILHNHLSQKRGKGEATFPMPVESKAIGAVGKDKTDMIHDRFLSPPAFVFSLAEDKSEDLDLVTNLP
jgi:hypothetical protein